MFGSVSLYLEFAGEACFDETRVLAAPPGQAYFNFKCYPASLAMQAMEEGPSEAQDCTHRLMSIPTKGTVASGIPSDGKGTAAQD